MILKGCILLLLVAACKCNIYCDFKKDLCNWSNVYECHFKHETKIPLAGKVGYLEMSKNTCNIAGIINRKPADKRFRFNYFFNGIGRANIYVYAVYTFSGRSIIWQCAAYQGPKWNAVEINIQESFFNSANDIIIEVNTADDVTIAIGNIEFPKHERLESRCPPSPPIIQKTTTKIPTTREITKRSTPSTTPANAGKKNHTLCSFTLHLCKWKDFNDRCHFKHVKDTPLLGETGYLMLSKDTCNQASLEVSLKEHKFQLHYLMNGTGEMSLSLGVFYGFSGKVPVWSCSTSQGPQWQKVDIRVYLIHFDPRISIFIDAQVKGDATIAIGNIAEAGNGVTEKKCPSRLGHISTTPSTLPESTSNNRELASSSSSSSGSSSSSSSSDSSSSGSSRSSNSDNSSSSRSSSSSTPLQTHQSTTVTNNVETKSESKLSSPTISIESTTEHSDQKSATSKPSRTVTPKDHPKPSITTVVGQPTKPQVEYRTKSEHIVKKAETSLQQNSGSVIGGSVVAAIVVVAVTVFIIFMYRRKIRMWHIQRTPRREIEEPYRVFENAIQS